MGFNCGIVGLPNVGKSTIFNALTAAEVEAANYPFCTIDPNTGVVPVPDERLQKLSDVAKSAKIIPTTVEFVDIAGLVAGASKGEGLGNQFLGHIRSVDAIVHVVRCFEDENVTHVHGGVSPRRDAEIIQTELLLSDLGSVEKRLDRTAKAAKSGDKKLKEEVAALEIARGYLDKGIQLRLAPEANDGALAGAIKELGLLTSKPVVYVGNVLESDAAVSVENAQGALKELVDLAHSEGSEVVVISGKVESEISLLQDAERLAFLEAIGLNTSGLERLILTGYNILNLISFFTVGPKETHAWTCAKTSTAPQAAGKIHTDFEKGFIRGEVISYDHYIQAGGEQGAKDRGWLRVEGKNYIMQDGDVVHFRFNV